MRWRRPRTGRALRRPAGANLQRLGAERLGQQMLSVMKHSDHAGAAHSDWVLISRDAALLGREELTKHKIESDGRKVLWTDARSDLMAILMQRE